ncbi:hypothetical protein LMG27198_34790 [Methylocystis echinoides]|jgi:hypothetical protein|uniref:Uncharacterized protein n=1 Tax=Methylocystis echinoides TaxID=29468 RepID=A0A9W6GWU6_9HYPH|nr:hypothetical protein LMG27198_34790 [Methylocystis echinoides]
MAGEGTLITSFLSEGANLLPLPRSGGGLGRGLYPPRSAFSTFKLARPLRGSPTRP